MPQIDQEKLRRYMERVAPVTSVEALAESEAAVSMVPMAARGRQRDTAATAVQKLAQRQPLTPDEQFVVEAIILPDKRPVIDIIDGDFTVPGPLFASFSSDPAIKKRIQDAIPAIGRIDFVDHPTLPYGGTGFVVGDGILMTNRHVAELFVSGVGTRRISFQQDFKVGVDFRRERDRPQSEFFDIRNVLMIHPYWDMALLSVDGLDRAFRRPLRLTMTQSEDLSGRDVAVIGYPAFDPRNNTDVQNRVFGGVYYVKRLQPGQLNARGRILSFGNVVDAATHDSSTLGGNSGSAVIDTRTGLVAALHFAGRYLEANYAVPAAELARDARVVDAGVEFENAPHPAATPWDDRWAAADGQAGGESGGGGEPGGGNSGAATASTPGDGGPATLVYRVPIEITVRVGTPESQKATAGALAPAAPAAVAVAAVERMVEPAHQDDYDNRRGYDPGFLGIAVPLPEVTDLGVVSRMESGEHVVPYHHFSLVMHKTRRLALFTASNVDASPARKEPEPGRDYSRDGLGGLDENDREKWFTDPRLRGEHQLPNRFFDKDRKAFDKGHIVRREDVAWGDTYDEVRFSNGDTFHATNCSPQVAGFNQSRLKGLWGKLENLVLDQAKSEKLCVLAGPVLDSEDPFFSGVDDDGAIRVRIPRRYWKIVVARKGDRLQAFAFVLEQDLTDVSFEFAVGQKWRERMTTLPALERDLGIVRFAPALHEADQAETDGGEALRAGAALELVR